MVTWKLIRGTLLWFLLAVLTVTAIVQAVSIQYLRGRVDSLQQVTDEQAISLKSLRGNPWTLEGSLGVVKCEQMEKGKLADCWNSGDPMPNREVQRAKR